MLGQRYPVADRPPAPAAKHALSAAMDLSMPSRMAAGPAIRSPHAAFGILNARTTTGTTAIDADEQRAPHCGCRYFMPAASPNIAPHWTSFLSSASIARDRD